VWDFLGLSEGREARLNGDELKAVWDALTGDDAARAYRGVAALATSPERAVPFLRESLRPAAPPDARQLARLLADLDSDAFAVREKATRELEALGEAAAPAFRKALEGSPSLETRRRVTRLLEQATVRALSPEQLRVQRAAGCPGVLRPPRRRGACWRNWAGAPEVRLTRDANSARKRLDKRNDGQARGEVGGSGCPPVPLRALQPRQREPIRSPGGEGKDHDYLPQQG